MDHSCELEKDTHATSRVDTSLGKWLDLRSASNMVLILAASKSCQGRSFEIRDGNNEFPVNSVPWTSDNGLIVLYGLYKEMRS